MSWDLWAILAIVIVAGLALLAVPVVHVVSRAIQWARLRKYSRAYLPHSHSGIPWRDNVWRA
jgi:hypothetical protein